MAQGNLQVVKSLLNTKEMQKRFGDVLGKKAPQFMASITNAVAGNDYLQRCDANSIMAAALVAAALDLPIDPNLGFSAIVPYGSKAQFQMMYKGFIQLAIRSGYYENMNYAEVYEDEFISHNPITGETELVSDFSNCKQRAAGETEKIVGYYAWFRLREGFRKELYMSREEVENHARTYSQSYQRDLSKGKQASRWSIDFDAMAKKTVIKMLLSKWGILSVEMQRAITDDQKVYDPDGIGSYEDNPDTEPQTQAQEDSNVVDAVVTSITDEPQKKTAQKQAAPAALPQAQPEQPQPQMTPEDEFLQFEQGYNEDDLPFA